MGAYEHLLTKRDVKDVSNLGWVRPVDVSQKQVPESMVRQVPDELLKPLRQTSHKLNGIQNMRKQVYLNGERMWPKGGLNEELRRQLRVEGSLATVYVWKDLMVTLPLQRRHERRSALRGQPNVTPVHVIPEMPNMSLLSKSMLASRAVSYSQNYPMMLPLRVLKKMKCWLLASLSLPVSILL